MLIPADLETPLLLLVERHMQHNIDRMQAQMDAMGVRFRPHAKTSKCAVVVERQIAAGANGRNTASCTGRATTGGALQSWARFGGW